VRALAERISARLKARGGQLVTAESCTGGWVAAELTAVAGASEWFERGIVAYSNAAKEELLGVRRETLERHGAVSEETAREMAQGALLPGRGGFSLSITGVAGPTGGTAEKPVGTVCLAWAWHSGLRSETRYFAGDRCSVRRQSVARSLEGLLEVLDSA